MTQGPSKPRPPGPPRKAPPQKAPARRISPKQPVMSSASLRALAQKTLLRLENLDTKTALIAGGGILALCLVFSLLVGGKGEERTYVQPRTVEAGAPPPENPGDVTGFRRDCVEQVLRKGAGIPKSCASLDAIRAAYRVDALDQLAQAQGLMVMTARRIVNGDILDDKDLNACIAQGACAPVPLPPAGDRAKASSELSPQSRRARDDFWRLASGDALGPELCAYMDICRALYKIGLISFETQGGE